MFRQPLFQKVQPLFPVLIPRIRRFPIPVQGVVVVIVPVITHTQLRHRFGVAGFGAGKPVKGVAFVPAGRADFLVLLRQYKFQIFQNKSVFFLCLPDLLIYGRGVIKK